MNMKSTQNRYTNDELAILLRILATDYNRRPSQRTILKDDRLPTHHTYRKRFGSIQEALKFAGVDRYPLSGGDMHKIVKNMLRDRGIIIEGEYVPCGLVHLDFVFIYNNKRYGIDIIEREYLDEHLFNNICTLRHALANDSGGDIEYILISDTVDMINKIDEIVSGKR